MNGFDTALHALEKTTFWIIGEHIGQAAFDVVEQISQDTTDKLTELREYPVYLAHQNGVLDYQVINAIEHTLISADITYKYSSMLAQGMGTGLEVYRYFDNERKGVHGFASRLLYKTRDTYKDQHNNALGRRIGEYANDHKLSYSELCALVMDAYFNGHMIESEDSDKIPQRLSYEAGIHSYDEDSKIDWVKPSSNWRDAAVVALDEGALPTAEELMNKALLWLVSLTHIQTTDDPLAWLQALEKQY